MISLKTEQELVELMNKAKEQVLYVADGDAGYKEEIYAEGLLDQLEKFNIEPNVWTVTKLEWTHNGECINEEWQSEEDCVSCPINKLCEENDAYDPEAINQ